MFTGIVSDVGEVMKVDPQAEGLRQLTIACAYAPNSIDIGASISCSGACLTVVGRGREGNRAWFAVDAAAETLRLTTAGGWQRGSRLNLERALKMGDRAWRPPRQRPCGWFGGAYRARGHDRHGAAHLSRAGGLTRFVASKGSVALDGISLTVNEVEGDTFSVLIIPHTLGVTTTAAR